MQTPRAVGRAPDSTRPSSRRIFMRWAATNCCRVYGFPAQRQEAATMHSNTSGVAILASGSPTEACDAAAPLRSKHIPA